MIILLQTNCFDFIFVNGYTSIRKVDLEFDCFKVITNFNEI